MKDRNVRELILGQVSMRGYRPSLYGERLGENLDPEPYNWRPQAIPFLCPECHRDFGENAAGLGKHLMTVHYPSVPKRLLADARKCTGGCGRWLEWNSRYDRSEARAHQKYCNEK